MNIKISKKRAAKILQEEVQKFLQENKDIDPKDLKEFLEQKIGGAEKWKDGWFNQLEDVKMDVDYE